MSKSHTILFEGIDGFWGDSIKAVPSSATIHRMNNYPQACYIAPHPFYQQLKKKACYLLMPGF